jgi:hypothetical protein
MGIAMPESFITLRLMDFPSALDAPVAVSDRRIQVRENARYALWQARHHYPESCI